MILLDDVLCDSSMGDAVVHVTALDVSKDGRIRRILDVRTVEIIGGHQDEVFHDGDILARKLAHMIDRIFAKDLHGVGTHQDGLDDAWHVQVDLKAGEYIDFTILHQLPAGQAVARERTSACAAYGLVNYRGSLCPCPRAAPFVHEGMRCTVTRNSHAKHPAIRSHKRCHIYVDRFAEKTHLPPCTKEGVRTLRKRTIYKIRSNRLRFFFSWCIGKSFPEKIEAFKETLIQAQSPILQAFLYIASSYPSLNSSRRIR